MKIFVTVGNTQYNSLITTIDELFSAKEFDITIQLACGKVTPKNHPFFRFSEDIDSYFNDADIIITHAGAGTVFKLLEGNTPMVVVPNYERIDTHQMDLAQYVDDNKFASVCYQLDNIKASVMSAIDTQYVKYVNEDFSGYSLINELFEGVQNNIFEGVQNNNLIAGLPLNIISDMDDCLNHIITQSGRVIPGSAIAINPEKVIRAMDDPFIFSVIMSATIRYPDGIGVVKTLIRKSKRKVSRIPGCELWETVMKRSGEFGIPVYLVGASKDVITATSEQLTKQYNVNVCGFQDGYFKQEEENEVIDVIAKLQPKVVTVALGSPRQEIFIQKCIAVCPDTFFMGVGGTYDVYTNNVKRAPLIFRQLNLEWFYRLMSQPSRIFRQTNLLKYFYLDLIRKL